MNMNFKTLVESTTAMAHGYGFNIFKHFLLERYIKVEKIDKTQLVKLGNAVYSKIHVYLRDTCTTMLHYTSNYYRRFDSDIRAITPLDKMSIFKQRQQIKLLVDVTRVNYPLGI